MTPIGLYPILNSIDGLEKCLSLGVNMLQLRIKDQSGDALEKIMAESVALCKQHHARLFINDYWELAIQYRAYGVHLGQEDLHRADIKKIKHANLHWGISAHTRHEIGRALAFKPTYIAIGPIFPTTSKLLAYAPIGIEALKQYCEEIDCPIVAIGGIHTKNIAAVLSTGVSGLAILSAVPQAAELLAITREYI